MFFAAEVPPAIEHREPARLVTSIALKTSAAALPRVSARDASADEGDTVVKRYRRTFLSTSGNQIIDADGNPVRLAGVNWFGLESTRYTPDGLYARGYKSMMDQMVSLGFNTIRIPFSDDAWLAGKTPQNINYALNPELVGKSPIEVLDAIVAYAGEIGLRIVLDHHRNAAGDGATANGLWYDSSHSEALWIANWTMLATRYAGNPTVVGADLHNEPHEGTWGGGGATDWPAAAERAGNAIHAVNPDWLIIVEGNAVYDNNWYWWGGNLMGVADRPVVLSRPNKIVYSPHDYPKSIYNQPWFSDPTYPANLPGVFDDYWSYIHREGIAPVLLGEFGSRLTDPSDVQWFDTIVPVLGGDYDVDGKSDLASGKLGHSWTWWSWNPNSGDTGGILADDWTTVNTAKVEGLEPIMFDWSRTSMPQTTRATFRVVLDTASTETVTVAYRTVAGTARANDFEAKSGRLKFLPGETVKKVVVLVTGDNRAEGSESFTLELTNPVGATLARATATGTIVDND